ncbi:hypothetical protein BC2230_180059 [Burkholderia cepacia]|uniref:hypothetical protein n=1 Tax=Burkholderia cepacia TaxID=292 RepID=UPI0039A68FCF
MNLNNFGDRQVVDNQGNQLTAGYLAAGVVYNFTYDGQRWVVSNGNDKVRGLYVDDQAPASAPNGLTINTGLGLTGMTRGFVVYVRAANTNSTGITLKVDNLSPIPAVASDGNAIQATGIRAGGTYRFLYDGQRFVTDVTNSQSFPIGTVLDFWGNLADVPTKFGPGWQLADGTNGTPDLRDRMTIGAGLSYQRGAAGGSTAVALAVANLPAHSHQVQDGGHSHHASWDHAHGINDGGHSHGVYQTPHGHGVNDGGHNHAVGMGSDSAFATQIGRAYGPDNGRYFNVWTDVSGSNISIQASNAQIGIVGSGANVSVQNFHTELDTQPASTNISIAPTGSGTAFNVQNPYVALFKIVRVS